MRDEEAQEADNEDIGSYLFMIGSEPKYDNFLFKSITANFST